MSISNFYFYQSIQASKLVPEESLEEIVRFIQGRSAGSLSTLDSILHDISAVQPLSLAQLQRLPKLPKKFKHEGAKIAPHDQSFPNAFRKSSDSPEPAIEWHKDHPLEERTSEEILLADELYRQGFLNLWQTEQLFEGRTKFSLGRYRIVDSIGKGGYGYVFLAREPIVGSFAAIKVLPITKATPELSQRFMHEIELQRGLQHPNLIQFIESGQDGNVNYMVHEFIDGGDLYSLLRQETTFPLSVAATIMSQVAKAVQYLHENGIVHRDIKPGNILLSSDGTVRLIDLGLAVPIASFSASRYCMIQKDVAEQSNSQNDSSDVPPDSAAFDSAIPSPTRIAGTVDYMSPDQLRDPSRPTPFWDIYSLGCTLYQMLTGRVPFPDGDSQEKFRKKLRSDPKDVRLYNQMIPFDIASLLRSMLTLRKEERIGSAQAVADRLDAWIPPDGLSQRIQFD